VQELRPVISNQFKLWAAEEKLKAQAQREEAVCAGKEAQLPAGRTNRDLAVIVLIRHRFIPPCGGGSAAAGAKGAAQETAEGR
jgi:hypothetical protein